jgi:hypothetical protein
MFNQIKDQDKNALQVSCPGPCTQEAPVFPVEFLNAVADTAFQTLQDLLQQTGAPKEASALLEDLAILTTWITNIEKNNMATPIANQILMETIANASRNIIELGGVFYSPSGMTISRQPLVPLDHGSE